MKTMMKLTESCLRQMIREEAMFMEIGDTTDFYQWTPVDADGFKAVVNFTTENGIKYYVEGTYLDGGRKGGTDRIDIEFRTKSWKNIGKSGMESTDQHNQFKVVSTVIRIAEQMWENKDQIFQKGEDVEAIQFKAVGKSDEKRKAVTARGKLYLAFIEKQFPSAEIFKKGNGFVIKPQ